MILSTPVNGRLVPKAPEGEVSVLSLTAGAGLGVVAGLGLAVALVAQRTVAATPAVPATFHREVKTGVVVEAEQIALGLHRRLVTQSGG